MLLVKKSLSIITGLLIVCFLSSCTQTSLSNVRNVQDNLNVLDPQGILAPNEAGQINIVPRLETLEGKTVWVLAVESDSFLMPAIKEVLPEYALVATIRYIAISDTGNPFFMLKKEDYPDAVVVGTGQCRDTTKVVNNYAQQSESMGIPAVTVFCKEVRSWHERWSLAYRNPDVRSFEIDYSPQTHEEAVPVAAILVPLLVEDLTTPLGEDRPRIAFTGTEGEAQKFFEGDLSRLPSSGPVTRWTDGLPVVIPTEERVNEMLTGTSHKPDEVVGVMYPVGRKVTVEKVAINAVMAGCKPEYMPVLLAIAEMLCKDQMSDILSTECQLALRICISGPIAKEINMDPDGFFSIGNPANETIGRAARLMLKNLGGAFEKASPGTVLVVTPFWSAFAENSEDSPWPSLGTDAGYGIKDSTVVLVAANNANMSYFRFKNRDSWLERTAEAILNLPHTNTNVSIVIPTPVASLLATMGHDKAGVKQWLVENTHETYGTWLSRSWTDKPDPEKDPVVHDNDEIHYYFTDKDTGKIQLIVAGGELDYCTVAEGPGGSWKDWVTPIDKWK